MTIIFFHGLGSSKKLLNYIYDNEKYNENNFIKLLEKIDKVYIPEIQYTNVYYYEQKYTFMKEMYKPIDSINYDDLSLDKFISKLYDNMDKTIYKSPYIIIGHSHGIYYACEFAKQFLLDVKYIISLDGSWITKKLNKQRLLKWKNKGKIIPKIKNQENLDDIINKIKSEKNNSKYIKIIFDYVRGSHTKFCIKQDYKKLDSKFFTFRDFNVNIQDNIMKEHNDMVIMENNILNKCKNHSIYILLDATHEIWKYQHNKNLIINTLKLLIN